MPEAFQPIAVRSPSKSRLLFAIRCLLDLQLLTIYQFLRDNVDSWRGRVLDVGAGEWPWRDLMKGVEYVGADVDSADEFGMRRNPDIHYYDVNTLCGYRDLVQSFFTSCPTGEGDSRAVPEFHVLRG